LDETAEASHATVQEADVSDCEIDLTEEPEALGECFPKSFFDSATVYTTSCSESDDDKTNEELSATLKRDDKVLAVLEALLIQWVSSKFFTCHVTAPKC